MTSQEVISRLKAEIERRKQSLRAGICSEDAFTKEQKREMLVAREEIDRFNRILDSLGAEEKENLIMANSPQLKSTELDKEMCSWFPDYSRGNASNLMERWGVAIARHFYELGKNSK